MPADRVAAMRRRSKRPSRTRHSSPPRRSGRLTSIGATHQHTMSLVKKMVGASPDLIARGEEIDRQED